MELPLDFSFFFCFLALLFPASGLGRKCTAAPTQWLCPSQHAGKVWELVNGGGLAISFLSLWELAQHDSSLWLHPCFSPAIYLCDNITQKAFSLIKVKQHLEAVHSFQLFHRRQRGLWSFFPVPQINCYPVTMPSIHSTYPELVVLVSPSVLGMYMSNLGSYLSVQPSVYFDRCK